MTLKIKLAPAADLICECGHEWGAHNEGKKPHACCFYSMRSRRICKCNAFNARPVKQWARGPKPKR